MPPTLALILTFAFIGYLFWKDDRDHVRADGAMWLPLFWMLIIGSRFVSQWLNIREPLEAADLENGSPVDRIVFLALILGGLYVLHQRQVKLGELFRNNRWLSIFFIYSLVSIVWSDFPFVAFKRWVKILGHPIMALIVLTEPDFEEALSWLMRRAAFVLIPLSVTFVKYFPALGRGYSEWTGQAFYTGVTTNKNALGYLCMVFGFYFVWELLKAMTTKRHQTRRKDLVVPVVFLAMILWLMKLIDAKTALVTFLASSVTAYVLGMKMIVKRYIEVYLLAIVLLVVAAETFFDLYSDAIALLGRDPTLTDRTYVWRDVLSMHTDPILGTGFESFWLGKRLETLWAKYWWRPNQAHNGYIETYLNLGIVGVVLFAAFIVDAFRKIKRQLLDHLDLGRFRFSLLLAILLFNYTDATFKALHPLWFVFYLIAMEYPKPSPEPAEAEVGNYEPQLDTANRPHG
jgi:exopolysaccharide production protein ExoQ